MSDLLKGGVDGRGDMRVEDVSCLGCGVGHYVLRTRRANGVQFYGCSEFPKCEHALSVCLMPLVRNWFAWATSGPAPDKPEGLTVHELMLLRKDTTTTIRW